MLNFVRELLDLSGVYLQLAMFWCSYYVEKLYEMKEEWQNWWNPLEISATEFVKNGDVFDNSKYVKNLIAKKGWIEWSDIKSEDTDFIEIDIKLFGKNKRFIFNEKYDFNSFNKDCNKDIVYILLQSSEEDSIDVTEYLKEFKNVPVEEMEYKFFDYELLEKYYIPEDSFVDLVVSKISEENEITYRIKEPIHQKEE